ncbi:hypothetical protein [Actinomyces ruminicola]|nr:hypothetical protein [Actinomyces ruminicola]
MTEQRTHPEMDASWAPVGWEPSDIGFDDAPFGTVLGDPLMGSPVFDVSVLDAAPVLEADGADARPASSSGAARRRTAQPTTRKQHQQATQTPSHRQSTTRPQAQPASPSASGHGMVAPIPAASAPTQRQPSRVAAGYGVVPTPGPRQVAGAVGGTPAGRPAGTASPAVTGNRRNPYAPVQAQRPQPATPSATAYGPPPQPAEHNPYGRPPAPPGTGPTPRPASQGDDTKSIEKLVAAGIGWVVFILFMIIFAST